MKRKFVLLSLIVISATLLISSQRKIEPNFPELKGPYLGQKLPGTKPEIFAPAVFSIYKNAYSSVFSPCGNEFYFARFDPEKNSSSIFCMKKVNNIWKKPIKVSFNSKYTDHNMCLSVDGFRMFFRSKRPLPGGSEPPKDRHYLWYVIRTRTGWSTPRLVEYSGYKSITTAYQSITSKGTLYFATPGFVGDLDLHCSRFVDGSYAIPKNLGEPINTKYSEADMYIAPDESYIIASCWDRPDNNGESDLYISFQKKDGSWTKLLNLDRPINNELIENCPMVSPDGRFFFFLRYDPNKKIGQTYWVDAKILETFRSKELK
jgi:hypothetical protein